MITSVAPARIVSKRSRRVSRRPRRCCSCGQQPQAVLDDDDGAVDDDAEVDGAEAHQVGADLRSRTMPVTVISIDSGMTQRRRRAPRGMLPSSRNSTTMTSSAPSSRFFSTVAIVASTSVGAVVDRARHHAFGQRCARSPSACAATRCATVRLFSPISIIAVPSTTSLAVHRGRAGAQLAALLDLGHVAQCAPARRRACR